MEEVEPIMADPRRTSTPGLGGAGAKAPHRGSTAKGRRAVLWILALALAVFALTYVTSPRDTPTGDLRDLRSLQSERTQVVPGQAGP